MLLVPGLQASDLGNVTRRGGLPFSTASTSASGTSAATGSSDEDSVRVPIINQLFTYACPTRAPGDQRKLHSVVGTLLSCPLQDSVRKKKEAEQRRMAGESPPFRTSYTELELTPALAKSDASSPLIYLLTPNQMLDNDYNLPSYIPPSNHHHIPGLDPKSLPSDLAELLSAHRVDGDFEIAPDSYTITRQSMSMNGAASKRSGAEEEWVETPQAVDSPTGGSYPVLAMDCEMVSLSSLSSDPTALVP